MGIKIEGNRFDWNSFGKMPEDPLQKNLGLELELSEKIVKDELTLAKVEDEAEETESSVKNCALSKQAQIEQEDPYDLSIEISKFDKKDGPGPFNGLSHHSYCICSAYCSGSCASYCYCGTHHHHC